MKIECLVWMNINGMDQRVDVTLTKQDIERIAMEKVQSQLEYGTKVSLDVVSMKIDLND